MNPKLVGAYRRGRHIALVMDANFVGHKFKTDARPGLRLEPNTEYEVVEVKQGPSGPFGSFNSVVVQGNGKKVDIPVGNAQMMGYLPT